MSARLTSSEPLLRAQQRALTHEERIATLKLEPLRKGAKDLDVTASLIGAMATLTIEGASTLELSFHDPDWLIERSSLLDIGRTGRMNAVLVKVDGLRFRLVKASRQDPRTLVLTFEDEVAVLLRQHNKPMAASRNSVTRGEFIERMVRAVRVRDIPVYSPEGGEKKPIALPDYPDAKPSAGETGFDDSFKPKIKGVTADAEQLRNLATALTVADQQGATLRPRLAMIVAGIGESNFRAIANTTGSGYAGVFQAHPRNIPMKDTEEQARSFLKGGKGFQQGGAIKLARANPSMSPGEIATRVEASGKPGSFYDAYRSEADKIVTAWKSGGGASSSSVLRAKSYQFTRGKPGQKETSWDAAVRLAEEVRWRLFAAGGVVWFVNDDYLISLPARMVIEDFDADGLLEPPAYDWDHGKSIATCELRVSANRWSVIPGAVIVLRNMGPVTGRWIVHTVEQNLLAAAETQVTLTKPVAELKEPAPELISGGAGGSTGADADAETGGVRARILKIAERSMTVNSGFSRYSQVGALTADPTPASARTDCSQWIRACYLRAGAGDPGTNTYEMARKGKRTTRPRVGDIMLTADNGHCELYVGDGKTIGHGSPPIDRSTVAAFPGHHFVTYDFL